MPTQDTLPIKEKILETLQEKGPSLPIHISREIGQSSLFTSAFLSELLSEKRIKISNMKVGTSPIYYAPGTESQLEKYSEHLKQKEKEAFMLLKENSFLKDSEQEPAIRVALRAIKDFAKPLEKNNELYWRYFNVPETQFNSSEQTSEKTSYQPEKEEKSEKETSSQEKEKQKEIDIFDTEKKESKTQEKEEKTPEKSEEKETSSQDKETFDKKTSKKSSKKTAKKKASGKNTRNDKFFNKVKEFLNEKSIDITDIVSVGKNELTFKVKNNHENQKEKLLFAFNKKRISENDLIKANKKASELKLEYIILSLGEPLKRLTNLIDAINNLSDIEKMN